MKFGDVENQPKNTFFFSQFEKKTLARKKDVWVRAKVYIDWIGY